MKKIVMTLLAGLALNALPACADTNIEMVRVPAGSFTMGASPVKEDGEITNQDEMPQHEVKLNAFEIGKYEVTQAQWRKIMGTNPSGFKDCGGTCPVENVSWDEIQEFIRKLNAKTGKAYRLPSEAEWEYACRAGKNTEYCGGNQLDAVAWTEENSGGGTHPVGQKQANAFGLFDMSGNVWEWVQDGYHNSYEGAPTNGSAWADGDTQVLRGGSWKGNPLFARAAKRNYFPPELQHNYYGFRLARTLP